MTERSRECSTGTTRCSACSSTRRLLPVPMTRITCLTVSLPRLPPTGTTVACRHRCSPADGRAEAPPGPGGPCKSRNCNRHKTVAVPAFCFAFQPAAAAGSSGSGAFGAVFLFLRRCVRAGVRVLCGFTFGFRLGGFLGGSSFFVAAGRRPLAFTEGGGQERGCFGSVDVAPGSLLGAFSSSGLGSLRCFLGCGFRFRFRGVCGSFRFRSCCFGRGGIFRRRSFVRHGGGSFRCSSGFGSRFRCGRSRGFGGFVRAFL